MNSQSTSGDNKINLVRLCSRSDHSYMEVHSLFVAFVGEFVRHQLKSDGGCGKGYLKFVCLVRKYSYM